jgi:hypothetical protein
MIQSTDYLVGTESVAILVILLLVRSAIEFKKYVCVGRNMKGLRNPVLLCRNIGTSTAIRTIPFPKGD